MTIALVLGGANCLHDDMAKARALFTPDLIIATNHAGRDYDGHVDHWVTFHPYLFPGWMAERKLAGRSDAGKLWTSEPHRPPKTVQLDLNTVSGKWRGSSALLACRIGIEKLGCQCLLAGVPLETAAAHYDDPRPFADAETFRKAWVEHLPDIRDHVRSLSGWTRTHLGAPSREWLEGIA